MPRNIARTHAFWVTGYNYLGSFSETAFELYNPRLVSRQLFLIATHSMQRSDLIRYPTYKSVRHGYGRRLVDNFKRILPRMPNGAFLSATYEYTGTLCLIPADTNGGTVIRFGSSQASRNRVRFDGSVTTWTDPTSNDTD